MKYFVTAIDTDSGKTLASAILCEAFEADYWKPLQAGTPRDSDTVKNLISSEIKIHPETHLLKTPASPHASAKLDGVTLSLKDFKVPITEKTLIIEGAGGCLVPLNDNEFVIDMISHFKAEVILVADLYLGSINHTLLTIEALKKRKLSIKGIIFNGETNTESERFIVSHSNLRCLIKIEKEAVINKSIVIKYAQLLKRNWHE